MTAFLPLSDVAAAAAIGADVRARTFVDRPDLPQAWFNQLREWGFQPLPFVPTEPDNDITNAQAEADAQRALIDAQVEAMSFKDYREAREAHGWSPGTALPDHLAPPVLSEQAPA